MNLLTGGRLMDSVASLVSALRECHALDAEQLAELEQSIAPRIADPRALAADLLKRQWLDPFQINRIFAGRGQELVLGNYVLIKRLGEGGMGAVYKARNWKLGRVVAVKVIRKDLLSNPVIAGRFRREIIVGAQLDHPNIIRAFDAADSAEGYYIVMEYVEGIDLGRLVQEQGPVPVAQACDYIRQAALALQHAHEKGLVHRDIKPPNLLRATQGGIKLLDMGLARLTEPPDPVPGNLRPGLTQVGVILGTVDFIAPEQARDSRTVDIRADLYALGGTFCYLLTGSPPFSGGTPTEKLLKHSLDPPPPLKHLPPAVVAVIHKLLAKKPEDRYQTPADLAVALEQILTQPDKLKPGPAVALPATQPAIDLARKQADAAGAELVRPVARKEGKKSREVKKVAASKDPAAAPPERGPPAARPVVPSRQVARLKPDTGKQTPLKEPIPEAVPVRGGPKRRRLTRLQAALAVLLVLLSVVGVWLLARGNGDTDPGQDSPEKKPAPIDPGPPTVKTRFGVSSQTPTAAPVAWSPDGKLLAVPIDENTVHVHDATGARPHVVNTDGKRLTRVAVAPGPKGALLATAEVLEKVVKVWEVDTGNELHVLRGPDSFVGAFTFRAGGVLAVTYFDGSVRLWDPASGKQTRDLGSQDQAVEALAFHDGRLATGGHDGKVLLWDTRGEAEPRTLGSHSSPVAAVAFSPDGSLLASGSGDGSVKVWDAKTFSPLPGLDGTRFALSSLNFVGPRLLAAAGGGLVRWYDLEREKGRGTLTVGGPGLRLALAPGDRLLCAGNNGAVYGLPPLVGRGPVTAEEVLVPLLDDDSVGARVEAVRGVEAVGLTKAGPKLLAMLKNRSRAQEERLAVLQALRGLKLPATPAALKDVLKGEETRAATPVVALEALRVLAEVDPAAGKATARQWLSHANPACRDQAVRLLGETPAGARELAQQYVAGKLPHHVQAALQEVLARHKDGDDEFDKLAGAVRGEHMKGLVREYNVVGPFPGDRLPWSAAKGPRLSDTYSIPILDDTLTWQTQGTSETGVMSITRPIRGQFARQWFYALVYVHSPADQKAVLSAGSVERSRIWVNGDPVLESESGVKGLDRNRLEVDLKAGWNTVVARIHVGPRVAPQLILRLSGADNLRVALRPE